MRVYYSHFANRELNFKVTCPKQHRNFVLVPGLSPHYLSPHPRCLSVLPYYARCKSNFCTSIISVGLVLSYFLTHVITKDAKVSSCFGIRDSTSIRRDPDLICSLALSLAASKHSPCRKKEGSVLRNLQ